MKKIPDFKSEEEERKFWDENDSTDYADWTNDPRAVFPNLKPTIKDFDPMIKKARKQAQSSGLTAADITRAIKDIRR